MKNGSPLDFRRWNPIKHWINRFEVQETFFWTHKISRLNIFEILPTYTKTLYFRLQAYFVLVRFQTPHRWTLIVCVMHCILATNDRWQTPCCKPDSSICINNHCGQPIEGRKSFLELKTIYNNARILFIIAIRLGKDNKYMCLASDVWGKQTKMGNWNKSIPNA